MIRVLTAGRIRRDAVPRHQAARPERRRAGAALGRPSTPTTPRRIVSTSTTPTERRHACRAVPLERQRARSRLGEAAAVRQGLRLEPQRRPAAVRARRPPVLGERRRGRRRRPGAQRPEPGASVRQDRAPERQRGPQAELEARRLRPAEPVAVLVRPRERRPLHRRRRPGQLGGDRLSEGGTKASRTSAGTATRGAQLRPVDRAALRRLLPRPLSRSTRTARAARSAAATSTAAPRLPSAAGRYFYGDYCSGKIWSFTIAGGTLAGSAASRSRSNGLSSFGQDSAGELFLMSVDSGWLYRLVG